MPTSKMYFNYDNDKQVYVLPVLPDQQMQIKVAGETSSVTIDQLGELLHKGKRDAITIKFDSFFPAKYGKFYCSCSEKEFRSAKKWHKWILKLMEAEKPCHFVYTNAPAAMNIYADIINYTAKEQGGDPGTIYYTIELKEHRTPKVRKYSKKKSRNKNDAVNVSSNTGLRTNNAANSEMYKAICSAILSRTLRGKPAITLPKGTEVTVARNTDTNSGSGGRQSGQSTDASSGSSGHSTDASSGSSINTGTTSGRYVHLYYEDEWYYGKASCFNKGSAATNGSA